MLNNRGFGEIAIALILGLVTLLTSLTLYQFVDVKNREIFNVMKADESFYGGEIAATQVFFKNKALTNLVSKTEIVPIVNSTTASLRSQTNSLDLKIASAPSGVIRLANLFFTKQLETVSDTSIQGLSGPLRGNIRTGASPSSIFCGALGSQRATCLAAKPNIEVNAPLQCVTGTVGKAESQQCPRNYVVTATGNGGSYGFVCCPLPSNDILTGIRVSRENVCAKDEVIVGATASAKYSATLTCQGINKSKYKMGFKIGAQVTNDGIKASCTWNGNSQQHFGGGTPECNILPAIIRKMIILPKGEVPGIGTDGCGGNPYGSVFVSRSQKYCSQQMTQHILSLAGVVIIPGEQ